MMKKSVLVVGGSGQIGTFLAAEFERQGWDVIPTHYSKTSAKGVSMDIGDAAGVQRTVSELRPSLIINSANVKGGTDACELEPRLATDLHFGGAKNLIDVARSVKARFVQISTDYVFDGKAGPYAETDDTNPLSKLGQAKLDAEEYAFDQLPDALVLRTSFVFSWAPFSRMKNFVMQIIDNDQKKVSMKVPNDQVGNVTYAPNFSAGLVELVNLGATGLFHLAGPTRLSKYDWALRVCDFFKLDPSLAQSVTTEQLKQAGPRPLESGFKLDKVQATLKKTRLMSLEDSLKDMQTHMEMVAK